MALMTFAQERFNFAKQNLKIPDMVYLPQTLKPRQDYDECNDGANTFGRIFLGEDLECDTFSSKCQEIGEGQGAFCKCNLGYHWPRALTEAGEPSDHLRTKTKECFKINECTGQIENQRNPDTGELGKVLFLHII